jgi:hypothetical protein
VQEETNLVARILAKLGETRYSFRRKDDKSVVDKTVYWFLMEPTVGTVELIPRVSEGILSAEWLTFEEALQRLTFPGDQEMVSRAARLLEA